MRYLLVLLLLTTKSLFAQTFHLTKAYTNYKSNVTNDMKALTSSDKMKITPDSRFVFNKKENILFISAGKYGGKYQISSTETPNKLGNIIIYNGLCKNEKAEVVTYLIMINIDDLTGTVMILDQKIQWNYEFEIEDQNSWKSGERYKISDQSVFIKKSNETKWNMIEKPNKSPIGSFFVNNNDEIKIFIPGQPIINITKSEQFWINSPNKPELDDNENYRALTWHGIGSNVMEAKLTLMYNKKDKTNALMVSYTKNDPNYLYIFGY